MMRLTSKKAYALKIWPPWMCALLPPQPTEETVVIGGRFGGFSFDAVFATWKTSKCIFNAAAAVLLMFC